MAAWVSIVLALIASTATTLFAETPVDFATEVQPLLTRYGCNAGACHGKQRGQNGFQLSLLGFDDDSDYRALVAEGRGRRVSLSRPEESLLLTKPAGKLPHGGGIRLPADSAEYQLLLRWIREGGTRAVTGRPQIERITLAPTSKLFLSGESLPLTVTAHWSDGSTSDVTRLATYQSSESAVAAVSEDGIVIAGPVIGEAAVMSRFLGHFAIFTASVPLPGKVDEREYAQLPRNNFIDEHLWTGHQRLGLLPSEAASDATFLRRVTIDIIGRVPTLEETETFLNNTSESRRVELVDRLLDHPEYVEHWANKWADLLRPNPYHVGIKATFNYDAWIRNAFRRNQPYDEFVRELLTAEGSTFKNGNVTLFRDRRAPEEITTLVSQLFLGVRLECAKCHHHPFEVYGQDDFYSFAAYFAKVGRKGTGISAPISGSEEFVFAGGKGEVKHPLTDAVMSPRALYGTERDNPATDVATARDPRTVLAQWITAPENHYFAQTMANRVWADLMGVGLVEPVDDLRATNPPVNGPLLEALARDFVDHKFDIKHLIRRITLSHAYGLSSIPNERNIVDTRHYSRHYRQRLRAEVLLDSISQITNQPESFDAMPPGSLAKELWTHRIGSLFLDAYGRPDPNQDPPCERTTEPTVVQTLHLMNSENLFRKVTADTGRAAELAKSDRTPDQIVRELYLSIYSRVPTEEELHIGVRLYDNEGSRRQATEDLMWALLNTPEFVFKD